MKDMVFSGIAVDELNTLAAQKLAPHLFVCCNFNPVSAIGLSDDGKYYPAMLNLYKVAFDSSCIIKKLPKFKPTIKVKPQWKKTMEDCLGVIEILRSVIAHNNSEYNGHREMERLEEYKCWIKKVIGKEEPVDSNDYTRLFQELQRIGDRLYFGISEYIEVASQSSDKSAIIQKWEDMIIDWYCGSTIKREIFLGELENEYLARAQKTSIANLDIKVARWVKYYYTKEYLLNDLQRIAIQTKDKRSRKEILSRITEKIAEIERETQKTVDKYGDEDPFCYNKHLFDDLKPLLRETIDQRKCSSMLPDDLLQYQIHLLFDGVPSADGDF